MKKLSKHQRYFQIKQSQKALKRRSKRKNKKPNVGGMHEAAVLPRERDPQEFYLYAPEDFSVAHNTERVVAFFEEVHDKIKRALVRDRFFFDLSAIKTVSADAVMYLVALLQNTKKLKRIISSGNEPQNEDARQAFINSGFYHYVKKTSGRSTGDSSKCVQIFDGEKANYTTARKLCDFVSIQSAGRLSRIETKRLYAMLVELMNNSYQHAYINKNDSSSPMQSKWYVYAEDKEAVLRFIFLDTGSGIPRTIRKNFFEVLGDLVKANDSAYIASALRGEFRTNTREEHRGKGLPEIYGHVGMNHIGKLSVISGKGFCKIDKAQTITMQELESEFKGTMFIWDVEKGEEE